MASKTGLRKLADAPVDDWDPIDPRTLADPHGAHVDLRARCPVAYSSRWGGFFTLTRHADIVAASWDSKTFTATRQTVIPASPRKGLPRLPLQLDPPEHTRVRKSLNVYFKESRIRRLEPELTRLADGLFDTLLASNPADFAGDFAAPFAQGTLCVLVGLDLAEADRLGRLSHDYVAAVHGEDLPAAGTISVEVDRFATDLVADRKRAPRDPATDLVSGLLADRARYSDVEVAGMIRLLLIGGHTVPTNFLGSAAWHLGTDQELQRRLREAPSLLRGTIEELLRFHSPNQALVRVATRDVEIGGRTIPEGCPVALLFLSGNRDEAVFEDPASFRPERKPNRHIAFGVGPHACIGQSLAQLQARIAIAGLLARTRRFGVAGEPQWARWTEYGVSGLKLDFEVAETRGPA